MTENLASRLALSRASRGVSIEDAHAGGLAEDCGEATAAPPPPVSASPWATRSFATQPESSTAPAVPKSRSPWTSSVSDRESLQPRKPFEETF